MSDAPVFTDHDAGDAEPRRLDPVEAPSHAEQARSLVSGHKVGSLATLNDGHPFGSLVAYAIDNDGRPVTLLSELAEHTRNARRDSRASLLVVGAIREHDDPMAVPRVTLAGNLRLVPDDEAAALVPRYLDTHPTADAYASFGDFAWWRLEVESVRFVGGYGRMSWVDAETYVRAQPDPIAPDADAIIEHMNADHADANLEYVRVYANVPEATSARMIAVDRLGMELVATTPRGLQPARVNFDAPVDSKEAVRKAVVAMLRRARAGVNGGASERR
jgi:putative heme iron utilization protein